MWAWVILTAAAFGCTDAAAPAAPLGPPGDAGLDARPVTDANADGDGAARIRGAEPFLPSADDHIVLAYQGAPAVVVLRAEATPGLLDVHFSVDTTGSFGGEIDALQADLRGRIVPRLAARVDDVAFGVSRFEDFPSDPFGVSSDVPFELLSPVTTRLSRVSSAVAALDAPLGNGGDLAESGAEALYQIATGLGYRRGRSSIVSAFDAIGRRAEGAVGGVGFRDGSLRVVVHITDAPPHAPSDYGDAFPDTHDIHAAAAALSTIGARVIGIASNPVARAHLEYLALATGGVAPASDGTCNTGVGGGSMPSHGERCALVFDVNEDGSGLSDTVVDAITALVLAVRYDEVHGDTPNDRLRFVQRVEALEATVPSGVSGPSRHDLRPAGDGVLDTFVGVPSGAEMTFEFELRNTTIPPADYDQSFRVTLEVLAGDLVLARRVVRVTVPRGRITR